MKRKQGRPKLPKKDLKSVRLPLRITPETETMLKAQAEAAGVKYTTYVRAKLLS